MSVEINCSETSAIEVVMCFVAFFLVQRHEAAIQEGVMNSHLCSVSCSNTHVPLFSCRHFVFLERRFNLVTFPFTQALPCGNVHLDRLLVSLLWCSAFSLSHPDSLKDDETMHIGSMAQAVASKSFGSVVLSALPSHAYLIPAWTPRYARSRLRSRTTARTQRVTNTPSGSRASDRDC